MVVFDIDGVIRDVGGSYRRALADTVEHYTQGQYRPSEADIDHLKQEGCWNNDWEGSQELVYRYFESQGQPRSQVALDYATLVDFFQRRYRGPNLEDPAQWTGYIAQEPLLVTPAYFRQLTQAGLTWGFFSGATRGSAQFILERRLGLVQPVLVAMDDAPGKPDPTGLFDAVVQINQMHTSGLAEASVEASVVIYAGDTVADMETVVRARSQVPQQRWLGVGVLPPHVLAQGAEYADTYRERLRQAGATVVVDRVVELDPPLIHQVLESAL